MQPIDIFDHPTAQEIISECRHRLETIFAKPVKVEAIIQYHLDEVELETFIQDCCNEFGVNYLDITSSDRSQPHLSVRQAIIYAAYSYSTKGLKEIGRPFKRDHTTVLHSIGKMAGYLHVGDKISHKNMAIINQLIQEKYHSTNLDAVENLG